MHTSHLSYQASPSESRHRVELCLRGLTVVFAPSRHAILTEMRQTQSKVLQHLAERVYVTNVSQSSFSLAVNVNVNVS